MSTPTPDSLTFDDIYEAAMVLRIVTFQDGWDAIDAPGAPGRDEARRRICAALARKRSAS